MSERNRRGPGGRERQDWRPSDRSRFGQDEPWREERRQRYPDEPYGGERSQHMADEWQGHRGRGWQRNEPWRGDEARRPDYRGDFGPSRWRDRDTQPTYGSERDRFGDRERGGSRGDERRWRREEHNPAGFGFGPGEDLDRGGSEAYGSPGRGDWPESGWQRGEWRDTDWSANRPARGRGTFSGDWELTRGASEGYAGRGPRDYRRSDDRIREEVCDRFTDDDRLDPSEVTVKVESGEVTLMGSVSSRDQKWRAEELAERISGVRDVINQLRVNRPDLTGATTTPPTSARAGRGGAGAGQQGIAADRGREER